MKSYTTREAKDGMGQLLKAAREAPVEIKRYRRRAAVVLSPRAFNEYQALKRIINTECVHLAVEKMIANYKMGDSARGHGAFRALAPYWAEAGVGDRRRRAPRRHGSRPGPKPAPAFDSSGPDVSIKR